MKMSVLSLLVSVLLRTLCDAPNGRGGSWSKTGVILFTPTGTLNGGLMTVSENGGTPIKLNSPDTDNQHEKRFLTKTIYNGGFRWRQILRQARLRGCCKRPEELCAATREQVWP
jgi:hypothetical protein